MEHSRAEHSVAITPPPLTKRLAEVEHAFASVNQEFFENLRLFVERVMLYRVTRAEKKNMELDFFTALLKEAIGLKKRNESAREGGEDPRFELIRHLSGYREDTHLQLSGLFSSMIEATEHLDPAELLYLLERLRTAPIFRGVGGGNAQDSDVSST